MKEFLSQRGVAYEEKDVAISQQNAQEMVQKSGQTGVPVILVDGEVIVGFDKDRLERLIAAPAGKPPFGLKITDAKTVSMKQSGVAVFGAYVGEVRPSSIAARMGLKPADIITELNMQPIHNAHDLEDALQRLTAGARVQIVFERAGKVQRTEGVYQ